MINKRDLIELKKRGIKFAILSDFGWNLNLTPNEVLRFISDPEKFYADRCGMSLRDYRTWKEFARNPQCTGTTKKGERCNNGAHPFDPWNPQIVIKGIDDRCLLHKEKVSTK